MSTEIQRKAGMMEKHWTTGMVTVTVAMCGFVLKGVHDQSAQLAAINAQLAEINRRVDMLDVRFTQYTPSGEVNARFATVQAELRRLDQRIEATNARKADRTEVRRD